RLGVELALVAAEVGDRVITRNDVDAYAERVGPAGSDAPLATDTGPAPSDQRLFAPTVPSGDRLQTRIPVKGVRKATAQAMVRSAFTAPHVTTFHTVDVTATMELIDQLRADRSLSEHRIGPLV